MRKGKGSWNGTGMAERVLSSSTSSSSFLKRPRNRRPDLSSLSSSAAVGEILTRRRPWLALLVVFLLASCSLGVWILSIQSWIGSMANEESAATADAADAASRRRRRRRRWDAWTLTSNFTTTTTTPTATAIGSKSRRGQFQQEGSTTLSLSLPWPLPVLSVPGRMPQTMSTTTSSTTSSAIAKENVTLLFWMHIQKTGTSFFDTIFFHFCPKALAVAPKVPMGDSAIEAYFGNVSSSSSSSSGGNGSTNHENASSSSRMDDWCHPYHFYNLRGARSSTHGIGYHWPYQEQEQQQRQQQQRRHQQRQQRQNNIGKTTTTIAASSTLPSPPTSPPPLFWTLTMFRDPIQRLISAYDFGRHGSRSPLHTKMANNYTISDYLSEPQIPNCQIKMVLGYHCHRGIIPLPTELNLTLAIERISGPLFFFGMTNRWYESLCLFHAWFGGTIQPFESYNSRPSKKSQRVPTVSPGDLVPATVRPTTTMTSYSVLWMDEYHDLDMDFIAVAVTIFNQRLEQAQCMGVMPGASLQRPQPPPQE
jgi:hypothetical protein